MAQASSDERELKSYSEHLDDLRSAVLYSLIAVTAAAVGCFCVHDQLFWILTWPLRHMAATTPTGVPEEVKLLALRPSEGFTISLKAAFAAGVVVASPYVFFKLGQFVSPGLTAPERRLARYVMGSGVLFFLLGVLFCYFLVLRLCLVFFWNFNQSMGFANRWTIGDYIDFVATMLLAFGVAFELPVVAAVLARLGLLTRKTLIDKRRYAIVGIFILAAVLTPPDVLSQILLAFPMVGLYELSVLGVKLMERKPPAGPVGSGKTGGDRV